MTLLLLHPNLGSPFPDPEAGPGLEGWGWRMLCSSVCRRVLKKKGPAFVSAAQPKSMPQFPLLSGGSAA